MATSLGGPPVGFADVTPRQQPEQQAPPVQRLDIRYAKRGRARFTSHRDFSRAFERALRRALVPMAYSSGFNPHPRISYANASPTGAATEAEYLEIGLAERVDPETLALRLTDALPDGMEVVEVCEAFPGGLADQLRASRWLVHVTDVPDGVIRQAASHLLDAETVVVERMMKAGLRAFDARGAILRLQVTDDARIDMVIEHTTPLVRPDDVMSALTRVDSTFRPEVPALLTRLAQGVWDGERVVGPFEARRTG